MAQKVQKYMNTNELSKIYGKYLLRPVYDDRFITTKDLADFIQTQCTVKRSDIKAVLDELGVPSSTTSSWVRRSSSTASASSRWASRALPATPRQAAPQPW